MSVIWYLFLFCVCYACLSSLATTPPSSLSPSAKDPSTPSTISNSIVTTPTSNPTTDSHITAAVAALPSARSTTDNNLHHSDEDDNQPQYQNTTPAADPEYQNTVVIGKNGLDEKEQNTLNANGGSASPASATVISQQRPSSIINTTTTTPVVSNENNNASRDQVNGNGTVAGSKVVTAASGNLHYKKKQIALNAIKLSKTQ